jgi:hypothetical protein
MHPNLFQIDVDTVSSIGMTNSFLQTLFYPAGFYGREIYGKFAITVDPRLKYSSL